MVYEKMQSDSESKSLLQTIVTFVRPTLVGSEDDAHEYRTIRLLVDTLVQSRQ